MLFDSASTLPSHFFLSSGYGEVYTLGFQIPFPVQHASYDLATSFSIGASLVAQLVKNPPAMRETWVQPLGWEDPLEMGKATHPSILAWRIP